jgi:hypothetical protein
MTLFQMDKIKCSRTMHHGSLGWPRSFSMKPIKLIFLLAVSLASAGEKVAPSVMELPRPNSGTFSFAQAEARMSEILSNAPTPKLENWRNPYMGFSLHISKDDSLTVYDHWLKAFPEYSKPRPSQSVAEIKKFIDELPLAGNPAGVLVTSDAQLMDSKRIREILKVLFVPSVQLFYVKSSQPSGAANGSQNDLKPRHPP